MDKKVRIGGHVSAAGGLTQALFRAKEIGADTIQIFGSSPRQWNATLPNNKSAQEFMALSREMDIRPVFLHAPYLINLASPNPDLRQKSKNLLKKNLEIAEAISGEGVIFHLGSSKGGNPEEAREYLARAISEILKEVPGRSRLILENSAGGGDKLGSSLADLSGILKLIGKRERVKVCFDTAHALEAGVISKYDPANLRVLEEEIELLIGWDNISCLHVNDSKTVAGSHHDRHENIGQGEIGLAGFKNLTDAKKFKNLPWLLEVPGFEGEGPDNKNIDILRKLFDEK